MTAAWQTAQQLADRYEVHPEAALLLVLRIAVQHAQQVDAILAAMRRDATADDEVVRAWQQESRLERDIVADAAQTVVAAGIANRLPREVPVDRDLVTAAVEAALDALDVPRPARQYALRAALARLDKAEAATVEPLNLPVRRSQDAAADES